MDISELQASCEWSTSKFLILSENVFSPLIYYSHLLPILVSLLLGMFLLIKNRELLASKILSLTLIIFSIWTFFDLILWANEKEDLIVFFWSMLILFEPIIYAGLLYFLIVFVTGKDLESKSKIIISILLLPTIIFVPTKLAILGFDLTNCNREVLEGPLVYYGYLIEVIFSLWAALFIFRNYFSVPKQFRSQLLLSGIGVLLFMLAFAWGNISGSLSEDWAIGQYGLLGMPVLVAFLFYLITKFNTFNIKLLGSQALVITLWALVGSLLFLQTIENVRIITSITLIILFVLGIQLIRGVKREIEQREKIERLALDLEKANARLRELDQLKSEFLSFASHQIRSPLTAINGYSSMILQGDFGEIPEKIKGAIQTMDESSRGLVKIVNDFLDISRIEQGRMKYDMTDFDAKELAKEVVAELKPNVENKGLKIDFSYEGENFLVNGDKGKIKQVIGNIIDNSIKYTPEGMIHVDVLRKAKTITISVSDTGIGIPEEEIPKLFSKFSRAKEAHKTNVSGTGLGLYVAKQMIEAHKGKIWVESQGKGRGSTFFIEIPAK